MNNMQKINEAEADTVQSNAPHTPRKRTASHCSFDAVTIKRIFKAVQDSGHEIVSAEFNQGPSILINVRHSPDPFLIDQQDDADTLAEQWV